MQHDFLRYRILPFLRPIEDLLVDPTITEVMVNAGEGRVFVERHALVCMWDGVDAGRASGSGLYRRSGLHNQLSSKHCFDLIGQSLKRQAAYLEAEAPFQIPVVVHVAR